MHPRVRLPALAVAAAVGVWIGRGEMAWWLVMALGMGLGLGRWPRARVIAVVALVSAALGARARETTEAPAGIGIDDREVDVVEGWVAGPITTTRRGVSFDVEVGEARVRVAAEKGEALPGDRVRVTGRVMTARGARNPGAMDRVLLAQARGTPWEMYAQRVEIVRRGDAASLWRWPAAYARDASEDVAKRGGDRVGNALVRAAVLGDRSGLDDDTEAAWRAAGVYHALSVSGLHLAAVALVAFVGVGWLWAIAGFGAWWAPRKAAAVAALPLSIAYTLVTGAQIATLRALVVVIVMLVGELIGRRARAADALGLAALVILATSPLALYDPGFQLSFVAAATLVVAASHASFDSASLAVGVAQDTRITRALRAIKTSIAVALATAPITAWHFHEIAIGGAVGNLVATPLIELVTIPIGLAGLLLSAIAPAMGAHVLDLAVLVAGFTASLVAALATFTPSIVVPPPSGFELVACTGLYGAWAAARLGWLSSTRALAVAALAVVALTGSWAWRAHERATDDTLRITFLDVGQGDAAVVELPGGAVWLVDAGGVPGSTDDLRTAARPGEEIARFLRARRIPHVDVAVISHPHPDHYLGLAALAPRIPIATVWSAAEDERTDETAAFATVTTWLARSGTRHEHPLLGTRMIGDVVVHVWAPHYDPGYGSRPLATADPVRSVNDNSLVVTIERAGRCVLFSGDIEEEGEALLVASGMRHCDVVKVPHHGSPTSSSPALVAATRPSVAVISLGRGNRFGFPAPAVVARWEAAGAQVLRTDTAGAVTVSIDRAGTLRVATFD